MVDDADRNRAILGLVLNILVLPGLGTLIGKGHTRSGIIQLVTYLLIPLALFITIGAVGANEGPDATQALFPLFIVGVLVMMGIWVWGIVTMVLVLRNGPPGRRVVFTTP